MGGIKMKVNMNKIYDGIKSTEFHDDGDTLVIKQTQDVSGIIKNNVNEFNAIDERARWSDDAFGNKVASIPLTVFQDLEKQGITRGFTILDHKRFKEFLNNPDNRVFRTRPGRI